MRAFAERLKLRAGGLYVLQQHKTKAKGVSEVATQSPKASQVEENKEPKADPQEFEARELAQFMGGLRLEGDLITPRD